MLNKLIAIKQFLSPMQFEILMQMSQSDDTETFEKNLSEFSERIAKMPVTYEQDGLGDNAIAYLHYFYYGPRSNSDWYITEKDMTDGVSQAFGFVILNDDIQNAEFGYVSITEITQCNVGLNLCFQPTAISEIKFAKGIPLLNVNA